MQKKFIFVFSLLFLSGLMIQCTSGQKSLNKGKYYKATTDAIKMLQSNPNHKKATAVLVQSYPLAVEEGLRKIDKSMTLNEPGKYSLAAQEYLLLNDLADKIHSSPKALQLLGQPTDFSDELSNILPLAAEENYSQAERLMESGGFMDAREAYYAYMRADSYVKGYKDVDQKIQTALYVATYKVVVEKPIIPASFQLSSDFFYDQLMDELSRFSKNRFVRFYTWQETGEGKTVQPDEYMVLDFEDFTVGNMYESTDRYEAVRDSVVVGKTKVNGQSMDVYGTVKATVVIHKQAVTSAGLLSVRILNQDYSRVLQHKKFPGEFIWTNQWLSYNGDERALNDEEILMSKSGPLMPPPPQNLFVEFTKPIFLQTIDFARNYYSSF